MTADDTTSMFTLCNYPSLLTNGILRLEQIEDTPLENFSAEERWEHHIFEQLLDSYPGLLDQLKDGSNEEILHVGELIGKGATGARGDDTKILKSTPPLHRNSKIDCRFNHNLTGFLLCPTGLDWSDSQIREDLHSGEMLVCGDQWPVFLYAHYVDDHNDPWSSLLRSRLLVCAYKHVFTSPSSVDREPKATQSGNARLHGMNYSETFYHSLLDLLEDPEESKEVDELLTWWNHQVFSTSSAAKRPISANSALSKIRQK
ncbi:hypothetical protein EDD22DRAFT_978875 [Suillus occidentalis]|nr:hypothetical protein EDD22DRAFT_978875 [Suillus occidentalis]